MELGLRDKVVLITGGSDGIGKAAAMRFLDEGCKVAICGRSSFKLDAALTELRGPGREIMGEIVDVKSGSELKEFSAKVTKAYGTVHVWMNNAGLYPQKLLLATEEAEWDEVMDINLKSTFLGAKIAANIMKKNGHGGVILNASSIAALMPSAGSGAYAASKAAILSLTKTLAAELAPWEIRVVAYLPGLTETEMTKVVIDKNRAGLSEQIALHRIGTPLDIADPLVFLASDAARYITGTYLEISGGKFCVQNPHYPWTLA